MAGMVLGLAWSVAVLWIGVVHVNIPPFSRIVVSPFFAFAPGLVLIVMVGWIAAQRFFRADLIDGDAPPPGSHADINQRVLRNTVEQAVIALCVWPPLSFILLDDGLGVVMALSVNFAVARILFWIGYHVSPPLRAFGFAATMYPTVLAFVWGLPRLVEMILKAIPAT